MIIVTVAQYGNWKSIIDIVKLLSGTSEKKIKKKHAKSTPGIIILDILYTYYSTFPICRAENISLHDHGCEENKWATCSALSIRGSLSLHSFGPVVPASHISRKGSKQTVFNDSPPFSSTVILYSAFFEALSCRFRIILFHEMTCL